MIYLSDTAAIEAELGVPAGKRGAPLSPVRCSPTSPQAFAAHNVGRHALEDWRPCNRPRGVTLIRPQHQIEGRQVFVAGSCGLR